MTRFTEHAPVVPDQLTPLIDDTFMEVHERWQAARSLTDVVPVVPELEAVEAGGEYVHIARLAPHKEPNGSKLVVAFPYQQGIGSTMLANTAFMQQTVYPHSEVIMLPQTYKGKNSSFELSDTDAARLEAGSLAPIAEKYARVLDGMKAGKLAITGYSLGGRLAADIAAISGDYEVTAVNIDEAPFHKDRTAKQLQKDFMKSGGYFMQRKAMADAGLGRIVGKEAGLVLAVDYAKFGVNSFSKVAKLVHMGMVHGDLSLTLKEIQNNHPAAPIKVGSVEGSLLTAPEDIAELAASIDTVLYTGDAARKHTTGNNFAMNALATKQGLGTPIF